MVAASLWLLGLFVACVLLGSIPWGVVISRLFFKKDIRDEGSGNIGATNAARAMGKKGAAAVFLLDFGKGLLAGFLATLVAGRLLSDPGAFAGTVSLYTMVLGSEDAALSAIGGGDVMAVSVSLAFLGVVWGHIFCPWLGFKGGKGISAAVGCLFFVFGWFWTLVEIALFVAAVAATRHVSVGSILAAVVCPFLALYIYWGHWFAWILITIAVCTVIWAHRGNIKRLIEGTESRIGGKK